MRWLLPILTVFALIGQSVTSFAAAGVFGDASCCCPIKAKCKCHDHDGKGDPAPAMKRCAGDAKLVAPAVAAAVPTIDVEIIDEPRVTVAPAITPLPIPDDVSHEPEKPPF
ncbi:MAG: hypothetical protein M4D80_35615 [Myxococcota bacterium]|nr:hypothetical protein [Deltaproteobacteria bacterium]MDQ3340517.1 hypothetical protein [Myxococcota bacterium]